MGKVVLAVLFAAVFAVATAAVGAAADSNGTQIGIQATYSLNVNMKSGTAVSTIDPVTAGVAFGGWTLPSSPITSANYQIEYTMELRQNCGIWGGNLIKSKRVWRKLSTDLDGKYCVKHCSDSSCYAGSFSWVCSLNYNEALFLMTHPMDNWASTSDDTVIFSTLSASGNYCTSVSAVLKWECLIGCTTVTASTFDTYITVAPPPDPDLKKQYLTGGVWYGFSTPIKIKKRQSKTVDFSATNIGSGPSSSSGYVSMSVSGNLDIAENGGSYSSTVYPPGSQLSGKCFVPSSQYKLLDTWALYTEGQSRTIYTNLAGNDYGDGWIKIRAGFDTPANGLNTRDDPRQGEVTEHDQQCFPVYKIPVMVRECFADSDCPSDGNVGDYYCLNNDVYRKWRDYYCSASNACSYSEVDNPNIDCGDSYCESWQDTYCQSGNQLWHKRNCYDKGCSGGACFSSSRIEDVKIQDCPGKTDPWGGPYCAGYSEIDRSRWIYDGICSGSPASCAYKANRQETETVEQCTDYCDAWGANYCKAGGAYRSRTCHDKGCNTGDAKCYDNAYMQEEKVSDCAYGCDSGQCVACSNDDNCGGWAGVQQCCHSQPDSLVVCTNLYPETDDVWQTKNMCVNAGTKSSFCTQGFVIKQQCSEFLCKDGYCVAPCSDECQTGQARCQGNGRQVCGNYDGDVCLEWPLNGTANENCGQSSYCSAGSCVSCQQSMANCNQNSSDGCEVNLTNDASNCGSCGHACGPGQSCANGSCTALPSCAATNTSCGIYPNCSVCSSNDGCSGSQYNYYFCASNAIGCGYTADDCSDCSCACGGYGANESAANGNCNDGKDNDCDGSTDSSDTNCKSRIAGDVNGDSRVDIFDLAAVGLAFGSQPGDANWKPNADLTGDGGIDIFDLATVGLNYGRVG